MKYSCVIKSAMSAALLGFLALGLAPVASAGGNTTTPVNFNVTATVVTACTVSATNMVFGTVVPSLTTATYTSTTSNIYVTCSNNDAYTVALSAGNSTVETARFMQGTTSTNHLLYALFSDSSRSKNWGTTAGTVAGTGSGSQQTIPVYGQISIQTTAPAVDTYSDTISVTVTY